MPVQQITNPITWQSFEDDAIDSFVGLDREPFIDRRNGEVRLRIGDGVTPGGVLVSGASAASIVTPTILTPIDGGTVIAKGLIFTCSPFIGTTNIGDFDIHVSSYWEIANDVAFTDIIHASGEELIQRETYDPRAAGVYLNPFATYYIRVKHTGTGPNHSEWSPGISITISTTLPLDAMQTVTSDAPLWGDNMGGPAAMSYDGKTAVVGAITSTDSAGIKSGEVFVYSEVDGVWSLTAVLEGINSLGYAFFGQSLDISGDGNTIAVSTYNGTSQYGRRGLAYVFKRVDDEWTLSQVLDGTPYSNTYYYGYSVALNYNGEILVVGASRHTTEGLWGSHGGVYTYTMNASGDYILDQVLIPSDISSNKVYRFGETVAISDNGDTIVVGAPGTYVGAVSSVGSAYIFLKTGASYVEVSRIQNPNVIKDERFGIAVAISGDGNTTVISTQDSLYDTRVDRVDTYKLINGIWTYVTTNISSNVELGSYYGGICSMSYDGESLLVTESRANAGSRDTGRVFLYSWAGTAWTQVAILVNPINYTDGFFGSGGALSGDGLRCVIGASGSRVSGIKCGYAVIFG